MLDHCRVTLSVNFTRELISSPRDEIWQRFPSERIMKVVNQKDDKNKPITLRSVVCVKLVAIQFFFGSSVVAE